MKILEASDLSHIFSTGEAADIRQVIKQDGVIVYPTDTLYGLGVDACSDKAVQKLYSLKSRGNAPVSVLLSSINDLFAMAMDLSDEAVNLIQTFLPGALTVICKSSFKFAPQLVSPEGRVGFRVPGDNISRQFPSLCAVPITTTSVNPSGLPPASSRAEVDAYFGDKIELMVDIGSFPESRGSTVIDLTSQPFKILREGEISRLALQDFLN